MMPRPPPEDFSLRETRPHLGGGKMTGDKLTSTYDLVEQMQYLYVRVVKAKDLPGKDVTGSCDPYVEVKLGNYKGHTRHFEKKSNPEWNQVFAFSKDRMQASVLEVVVKDKDFVKDDFMGRVLFDLNEIPKRVPPDSPLAPQWYRLEDRKGDKVRGEIMLAVWMGTQADEAFPDAWHSDAATVSGTDALANIRSKVYLSPKLWYLRVNVIEAQDLLPSDKGRYPEVCVKAILGHQALKTRISLSRSINPMWNEDLMFVAAEPFEEPLILSVEDRVALNKDEVLGRCVIPLQYIERRLDHKPNIVPRPSLKHNILHFLRNPITKDWIVFFPTGSNSDQVGFVVLEVKDSALHAKFSNGDDNNCVFMSGKKLFHSIVNIVVSSLSVDSFDSECHGSINIGYLLAYTMYSVQWFVVKFDGNSGMVSLVELCSKVFKTAAVVHVCLCSKLPEFSVVLLDNGSLFLFDLGSRMNLEELLDSNIKGRKLRVPWERFQCSENDEWLGCEFGWHPKLLIVARSDAVFLVDFRLDQCNVSCIININVLGGYASAEKDRFLAFSRAGSTGFEFVVSTNKLLILCDVREPLRPILQWDHGLNSPGYIEVLRLSDMRSSCKNDAYGWASKSGYCVLLGSLWDGEFGLFCYGPLPLAAKDSLTLDFSKIHKMVYAWDLPSEFPLGINNCCSGSLLMKEEILKDSFPEWVNWQQKTQMVLGFGILHNHYSSAASEVDEYGGFTLIRLLSSGKLESQRYRASWSSMRSSKEADQKIEQTFKNDMLQSLAADDYKFPKKFKYFNYRYLQAYLNDTLPYVLDADMKKFSESAIEKNSSFDTEFHALLCKNLKAHEVAQSESSPTTTDIFKDIKLPTTISEISSKRLWSRVPMELMSMSFSNYSKYDEVLLDRKKVSLEFLGLPDLQQLPPFILRNPSSCSNKGSGQQLNKAIVGPMVPLPILDTLHRLRDGCSNVEDGLNRSSQYDEIMQEAKEMAMLDSGCDGPEEHAVSLSDDREDGGPNSKNRKPLLLYQTCSFKTDTETNCDKIVAELCDKEHVAHGGTNALGQGMFDDCCPIKLNFDKTSSREFGLKESAAYKLLERQFVKKMENCDRYQEFLARF